MANVEPGQYYQIEDAIARFWVVKDYVHLLTQKYIDYPEHMTEEEMHDQLLAIEYMLELYIDAAMNVYKKTFELDEYATPEQKAYREKLIENWSKNRQDWFNLATSVTPAPKKKVAKKKGKKK